MPLKIIGDGPESPMVERVAATGRGIEWLGRRPRAEVQALVGEAAFLVFPSEWYETFGRVLMEAFAAGTPVVASRLGATVELVDDGRTGLCYEPGDAADLVRKVRELLRDPARLLAMRRDARRAFEERYTGDRNYELLMTIYARAMEKRRRAG
jgi:glycosyltransferase involved in cell wall biosynthesis